MDYFRGLRCYSKEFGLTVQYVFSCSSFDVKKVSCVRSVTMDDWSLQDVLTMLEGGNNQLQTFFTRHALCENTHQDKPGKTLTSENIKLMRYKTKAALFYRQQLEMHVGKVLKAGPYRGREHSRGLKNQQQRPLSKANSSIA